MLAKYEESVAPFAKACQLDPQSGSCASLALALERAGQAEEAKAAAKRATAASKDPSSLNILACYHALAGGKAEALRLLRKSVEIQPGDPNDLLRDPDLASLRNEPEFKAIVAEAARRFHK